MPVHALDVDLVVRPSVRRAFRARRAPRGTPRHRPGDHPGHARGRGRSRRVDGGRRVRSERHLVQLELRPGHLGDHAHHALADLGGGAVHLGGEPTVGAGEKADAGRAVVVEAVRVAEVLEADGKAHAAPDALPARDVPGPAREPDRIARQLLGLRQRQLRAASNHLGDRERAGDALPVRHDVAGRERVPEPKVDGVEPERVGELVHLRLVCEAHLHGAESAHRAAGRVVRVDGDRLDERVRRRRTDRRRTRPRWSSRPSSSTHRRPRPAGLARGRRRACRRGSHGAPCGSVRDGDARGRQTTPRGCRRT